MLLVVTDEGRFWNHNNPLLEQYADCVLVVCLNGKKVTEKYRCFVSPYKSFRGLGMPDTSIDGEKYRALASAKSELRNTYGYHDDIVFLTDEEPQSLFPYLVLKDDEEYNRIHLWCTPPWKFEGTRKRIQYYEFLQDFAKVKSLLFMDEDRAQKIPSKGNTLKDIVEAREKYFSKLFPKVVCEIGEHMHSASKYYFDFDAQRYIEIDNSYEYVLNAKPLSKKEVEEYHPYMECCTLGLLTLEQYPDDSQYTKEVVERLHPRLDGKQICEQLKEMRRKLAAANNISIDIVDCPSTGPCAGTCPQCDFEICELQRLLLQIPEEQRVYPCIEVERKCGLSSRKHPEKELLMGILEPKMR